MIRLILEAPFIVEFSSLVITVLSLITYPALRRKVSIALISLRIYSTLFAHLIATFLYIFVVMPLIWSAMKSVYEFYHSTEFKTALAICGSVLGWFLPPPTIPPPPSPHPQPPTISHLTPQAVKSRVYSLVDEGIYLAGQNKCEGARNDQNKILVILKQNHISISMQDNLTPIEQEIQVMFTNLMSGIISCDTRASLLR